MNRKENITLLLVVVILSIMYFLLGDKSLPILIIGYISVVLIFIIRDMSKDLFSLTSLFLLHYSVYLIYIPIRQLDKNYFVDWYYLAMDRSLGAEIMLICGIVAVISFIFGVKIDVNKILFDIFRKNKILYIRIKKILLENISKFNKVLNVKIFANSIIFFGVLLFLYGIWKMGGISYLLSIYEWNSSDAIEIGVMTTGIQIAYTGIIISFYSYVRGNKVNFINIIKWPISYVFILLSGIKFIQGGRIQVLMACISIVLIYHYQYKKIKFKNLIGLGILGVMVLGYIGYYRDYKSIIPSDFNTMIKYILGGSGGLEYFLNSYTNFTTMHVINTSNVNYLWGSSILDGIIFMIPRFIFPAKDEILFINRKINELNSIEVISPVGGLNLAAQNLINGNIIFTIVFMFIIGILFAFINKYRDKSKYGVLLYGLIVPYFIVSFIRNPIYFTIKEIIQFCILPYIIFLILKAGEHHKEKISI